jgi:hypothetical protein
MKLITVTVKIMFEDDRGRPKSRKENYLVNARDFKDAIEIIEDEFNGTSETWEVVGLKPSSIIAILNYDSGRKITRTPGVVNDNTISETVLT